MRKIDNNLIFIPLGLISVYTLYIEMNGFCAGFVDLTLKGQYFYR